MRFNEINDSDDMFAAPKVTAKKLAALMQAGKEIWVKDSRNDVWKILEIFPAQSGKKWMARWEHGTFTVGDDEYRLDILEPDESAYMLRPIQRFDESEDDMFAPALKDRIADAVDQYVRMMENNRFDPQNIHYCKQLAKYFRLGGLDRGTYMWSAIRPNTSWPAGTNGIDGGIAAHIKNKTGFDVYDHYLDLDIKRMRGDDELDESEDDMFAKPRGMGLDAVSRIIERGFPVFVEDNGELWPVGNIKNGSKIAPGKYYDLEVMVDGRIRKLTLRGHEWRVDHDEYGYIISRRRDVEVGEDISRRGFLQGVGAAATLGAAGAVQAKAQPTAKPVANNPKVELLMKWAKKFITNPAELAAFMAQCAHESDNFKAMEEYGTPERFAKKYDIQYNPEKAKQLGNTQPGDGIKYRGRGYIQLTGKYNYQKAGEWISKYIGHTIDFVAQPDLVATPTAAALSSIWYWMNFVHGKTKSFANTKQVTKHINPGMRGQANREQKARDWQAALNVKPIKPGKPIKVASR